eukprot:gene13948-18707_t
MVVMSHFLQLLSLFAFIFTTIKSSTSFNPIQVTCEINGFQVPAIIDTGAEISVMSSSCARRCRVSNLIDTKYCGKVVGVGSSDILGGIDSLSMKIGGLNFNNKISILRDARCDLLIGLDILQKFNCEISLKERVLKFHIRQDVINIPMIRKIIQDEVPVNNNFQNNVIHDLTGGYADDDDYAQEFFDDDTSVSMEGV